MGTTLIMPDMSDGLDSIQIRKYLRFTRVHTIAVRKTEIWSITNNELDQQLEIGRIQWFAQWRRYCLYPSNDCIFDATCLDTIVAFIRERMDARRHYQDNQR